MCTEKNKFKWQWLDEEVELCGKKVQFGSCLEKHEAAGKFYCMLCQRDMTYATRGKVALKAHLTNAKHIAAWKASIENLKLTVDATGTVSTDAANTETKSGNVLPMDRRANSEVCFKTIMCFTY